MDRTQALQPKLKLTWFLRFLQMISSVFFFNTPNVHHTRLSELWLDRVVIGEQWERFVVERLREWKDTSLLVCFFFFFFCVAVFDIYYRGFV